MKRLSFKRLKLFYNNTSNKNKVFLVESYKGNYWMKIDFCTEEYDVFQ